MTTSNDDRGPVTKRSRGRPRLWSPERVLEAIRAFVREQGRVPGYGDFRDACHGLSPRSTLERYFPSWHAAVREAGYSEPPPARRVLHIHIRWRR